MAREEEKTLWANVVKCCYDAVEQAVSAALAKKGEIIPREHPEKIKKLINVYTIEKTIENKLFYWLRKRSSSQYVDMLRNFVTEISGMLKNTPCALAQRFLT